MKNKNIEVDEVVIKGVTYVPKSDNEPSKKNNDGLEFVIIRTYSAGVHAGYLKKREGKEVELVDSIRIWEWRGAFTLSQLAMEGVGDPDNCRFGMSVDSIILTESIEIIATNEKARLSIQGVTPCKK